MALNWKAPASQPGRALYLALYPRPSPALSWQGTAAASASLLPPHSYFSSLCGRPLRCAEGTGKGSASYGPESAGGGGRTLQSDPGWERESLQRRVGVAPRALAATDCALLRWRGVRVARKQQQQQQQLPLPCARSDWEPARCLGWDRGRREREGEEEGAAGTEEWAPRERRCRLQ